MASKSNPVSPPPFVVQRRQPELIFPAKPTSRELKELSDIDDQQGLRFQISYIMFYRSNSNVRGKDPARSVREAISEALVYYYPLAGRLIEGPNRKLIVDCSGEGVLFVEADANITIDQLGDSVQSSCPFIDQLLYDGPGSSDVIGCPLLLIQVTRLACGGFIFAIRSNHTMSDTLGLVKFLNATAEIVRGAKKPTLLPVWQREIFCARNPPQVTRMHYEYEEITPANSRSLIPSHKPNMVYRSVFLSLNEIESLRKLVPHHLRNCTTFELVIACLWKCRTEALELDPNVIVGLSPMINLRGRRGFSIPDGYYGNAFASPSALSRAGLLCKNPLGYALELVKKSKSKVNEEYVRSVMDLMVIKGRPNFTTEHNFLIADAGHVGLTDIDFGWGKPVYGGPTGSYDPHVCILARFKNSKSVNGVVVPIWLPEAVMERFEDELLKMTRVSEDFYDAMHQPKVSPKL